LSDDDYKTNSDSFSETEASEPTKYGEDFGISRLQRAGAMEQKLSTFKQRSLPKRKYLMKPAVTEQVIFKSCINSS
jgi:hypothetical protein